MPCVGETDADFYAYGFTRYPIKLRGHGRPFRPEPITNLVLKLRALFGVSARCEILLYLLINGSGHPRRIARETYFYQKTVQDALVEMSRSGIIVSHTVGRERRYSLASSQWKELLLGGNGHGRWITWPPLLSAMERIWLTIDRSDIFELEPLLQASELRLLMTEVKPDIRRAGFPEILSDDRAYVGEEYTEAFLGDMKRLLDRLGGIGVGG